MGEHYLRTHQDVGPCIVGIVVMKGCIVVVLYCTTNSIISLFVVADVFHFTPRWDAASDGSWDAVESKQNHTYSSALFVTRQTTEPMIQPFWCDRVDEIRYPVCYNEKPLMAWWYSVQAQNSGVILIRRLSSWRGLIPNKPMVQPRRWECVDQIR